MDNKEVYLKCIRCKKAEQFNGTVEDISDEEVYLSFPHLRPKQEKLI